MKSAVATIAVLSFWTACAWAQQKAPGAEVQCQVSIEDIKTSAGKADVTVGLTWSKTGATLDKADVRVVFLFAPQGVTALGPEILATSRNYTFNMPNDDLWRMVSGLTITMPDGKTHGAGLLLIGTQKAGSVDLLKSGRFTFPIATGDSEQNPVHGEGALSVAVFRADDPKQEFKNPKYTQLSKVATKSVDFK